MVSGCRTYGHIWKGLTCYLGDGRPEGAKVRAGREPAGRGQTWTTVGPWRGEEEWVGETFRRPSGQAVGLMGSGRGVQLAVPSSAQDDQVPTS